MHTLDSTHTSSFLTPAHFWLYLMLVISDQDPMTFIHHHSDLIAPVQLGIQGKLALRRVPRGAWDRVLLIRVRELEWWGEI